MATCAQIATQVLQICKAPGFTTAFDTAFQAVLDEMCETYDWEATKVLFSGTLSPTQAVTNPNYVQGQGPYDLPPNYLRMEKNTFVYYVNGLPYPLISFDDADYAIQVQQVGVASLPRNYRTDLSDPAQPVFYTYPPTIGSYAYEGFCYVRMPAVGSGQTAATGWAAGSALPSVSGVTPWFPNTSYLINRTAGEVMRVTGDTRADSFLGKNRNGTGAQDILERINQMKDDRASRAQRITFDRRRFGNKYSSLPDTKNIWG